MRAFSLTPNENLMRGVPVLLENRTIFSVGERSLIRNPIFGMYWDVSGFDNGTKTWVLIHIFRRPFSFWILNIQK